MVSVEDEMLGIVKGVWTKLQGLHEATSLDQGAFCVILLFAATFLFMVVLSCLHCCCCCCWGKPQYQASRVQPLRPV